MFVHIFTYRLRCLLRDRETLFWTALFPLILATLFSMAFSNLNSAEVFQPINIAVVDNSQYQRNENFKMALEAASEGEERLFNLTLASKEESDKLLDGNKIAGYIEAGSPMKLVVGKSGINQNIIRSFLDNYMQTVSAVESIISGDPAKLKSLTGDLGKRETYVREVSGTNAEPNYILSYFYTLIAMACFYGGFLGMREVSDIQADISPVAARVNIAPVHKMKAFLYSTCASLSIHFASMLVLLAYMRFALGIDFGAKTGYVLLTALVGSISGISFGTFISVFARKSEGMKIAVLIGVTMTCSFLAGMMYQEMKYIIAQKVPLMAWLNPLNLLTDAFYSLYYYDSFSRYLLNIGVLSVFAVAFCAVTYLMIRRRKYASL